MKAKMTRFSSLLIALMMFVSVMTGCGTVAPSASASTSAGTVAESTAAESTEKKEEPPKKDVVLKLLTGTFEDATHGQVVAAFEAKTGIKIEVEVVPDGPEGENIIKTRYATNEVPDIQFYLTGGMMNALNPEANFADLTNEPFMQNVDESFKKVATSNGKVYAVPQSPASIGAWFYNKKIYSELNLKIPKTWEELMNNCETIKNAGKVPIIAPYKDSWTTQFIVLENHFYVQQANPTFTDDYTANKIKLESEPEYIRGWERLQEVNTKGYVNKDSLSMTYESALREFAEGRAVHFPLGSFIIPTIAEKYPDVVDDFGAFAQPGDDPNVNGMTIWLPWGVFASKTSENLDAAKEFLAFYISQEGVDAFTSKIGPSGVFLMKGIKEPSEIYASIADGMKYVDAGNVYPAMEFECPIKPANMPQICVEVASSMITPLEGVQKMDKEGEKFAQSLKLPGW